MKLIISRHGEAENNSITGLDKDRPLSDKGRADILKMSQFIKHTPLKVNRIYHSPYLRTCQTADIYAESLGIIDHIEPLSDLAPAGDSSNMLSSFCKFSNSDTILVVGHNPDVSYLVAKLVMNEALASSFVFCPGATVAINVAREKLCKGQLVWMVSPDFL